MKKMYLFPLPLIFLVTVLTIPSCKDDDEDTPSAVKAKIMVASDLHLFDQSLLIADGVAFQTYLAMDRKLLKESEAITASLIALVKAEMPDLLLLPGDLTKDGEKVSHQNIIAMLDELRNAGITVLVINGNHDLNNPEAMEYNGNAETAVPTITPAEFETMYHDYGYKQAIARDANSLSYVAEPVEGLRIIALDGCKYNPMVVGGAISQATLQWALAQIDAAVQANKTIFGMMHHALVEHYTGQKAFFPDYVIDNWEALADSLAAHGLRVMFTGHYHAHDIVKREIRGNSIHDIMTGSTVTWPCPYRTILLNDTLLQITTQWIEQINYPIPGGVPFQTYAKEYLQAGMTDLAAYMLMNPPYNVPQEYALMMAPSFCNGFMAHYAGDEMPSAQDLEDIQVVNGINPMLGSALGALWTDLIPADNVLTISLPKNGSTD